ncbi:MAG TPA: phosphohistidine phosphatase SixA [Thermoanaerobaculia bacterium]|jgi:phosphohistidine phosphatase|nr:phosphohistidine phosphatase SixA [Thermoanaerobaculia bacterium]
MLIVLLRHGIAEEKGGDKPDSERRLTREGNEKMKRVAKALEKMLPDADAIYSSPLVRAYETAEWMAKAYDRRIDIETTAALAPGHDPAEFRDLLRRAGSFGCAYFAGHEPHLTTLMLALTSTETHSELSLKKGGCYGLELDDPTGTARLKFMLAPGLIA